VGSLVTVLLQMSPDSDSEISLKIGQYLSKLKRTKYSVPVFLGTLYLQLLCQYHRHHHHILIIIIIYHHYCYHYYFSFQINALLSLLYIISVTFCCIMVRIKIQVGPKNGTFLYAL